MKKAKLYRPCMLRPLIYLAATRLMAAGVFLLATSYIPNGPTQAMASGFLAAFFALLAYLVYLRMDGLRIPRFKYLRPKKKDPLRHYGDMADYTDDDPPVTFEELEDEEKDFCSLMANLAGCLLYLALSFLL